MKENSFKDFKKEQLSFRYAYSSDFDQMIKIIDDYYEKNNLAGNIHNKSNPPWTWINDENVHVVLVLLAIPISLFAMGKSLRIHHNYKCISLAGIGLLLLVVAIFMHDIGFSSDQSLLEQKQNLHTEESSGENNRKNYDDHDHHEHDEIAETLETIFTVLGGLVLLGAHYFNIKYTNKTA